MKNQNQDHQVLKLKKEASLPNGLKFPERTEFEIVMNVVYMGGFPVSTNLQATLLNWIKSNPNLFVDDTRKF